MKKLLIILLVLASVINELYSQGELNEQQKVFFRNEKSFAILLNSDGYALSYRGAKRIDYLNKKIFELDAGILKHQKEYKISNPYYQSGSFVYGKLNTVVFIRGGIGHQKELFKKADLGGIAIRYFYSVGPTIALYKPVYYRIIHYVNQYYSELRDEKFDVSVAPLPYDIYNKASFFKGLNETKVLPGVYVKGGFNFEYSVEDRIIHAVEIGAQINAFPKEIPIMASYDNKSIFFSLFVSYRFGIITDPLNPESNKLSNIFKRKE
jgi:hypothetical protein